jgi:hypothetical protein
MVCPLRFSFCFVFSFACSPYSIVQDSIFVISSHLNLTFCSVQIKNSKYKKIFKTNYHLFVILKGVSYNLKRPMVVFFTMVTRRASCIAYKHSFIQPFWKLESTKHTNIRKEQQLISHGHYNSAWPRTLISWVDLVLVDFFICTRCFRNISCSVQ